MDGWCGPIILGELREIYKSLITNSEPNLKQRRSYRDYIKWLQNQDQETARDYWQKELLGVEVTKVSIELQREDSYQEDILILSEQETNNLNKLAKDTSVIAGLRVKPVAIHDHSLSTTCSSGWVRNV